MAVLVVDTEVELRGVLGAQLRVAHERVVEVVQCRCAEDALVEGTHGEGVAVPRGEQHRREARERGCALRGACRVVADVRVEQCYVALETAVGSDGREQRRRVETVDIRRAVDVGRKVAPAQVGACRQREPARVPRRSHRRVEILLAVVVVAVHRGGVCRGVLQIAQPVIGILQVGLQREAVPCVAV